MRILYLSSRFPYPPNRGDRLTGYHLIRTMARRHAVTLVSFVDGSEPDEAAAVLSRWCEWVETVHLSAARSWLQAWLGLFSRTPSQVAYYRSKEMEARVRRVAGEGRFDAVFVQLYRMGQFARALDHPKKVLFYPDSFSLNLRRSSRFAPAWRAPGIEWEAARVERYEAEISRDFAESWMLSPEDARELERQGGQRVAVVRHGVDESLFDLTREPEANAAVFLGNLSVPHNVDGARHAALAVWPLVRRELADARLRIVGADAVPSVTALNDAPGVEVAGFVPDLGAIWKHAGLMLAALRYATGIQNKVLEAMAAGVPVVATPGVAAALDALDGVHLRVGDTERALADAVVETIRDPSAAAARAERARAHVREHFSWEDPVRRLERLVAAAPPAPVAAPR